MNAIAPRNHMHLSAHLTQEVGHRWSCHGRVRFLCVATTLLLFSTRDSSLLAQVLHPNECYRTVLSEPLRWATSAVWSKDQTALLVVDLLQENIVHITLAGQVQTILTNEIASASGSSPQPLGLPSAIREVEGGYLLEDDKSDMILHLNSYLEFEDATPVRNLNLGDVKGMGVGVELIAVYDWTPMGNGILAFGDLKGPGPWDSLESWKSAFIYFDKDGHEVFYFIGIRSAVRNYYVRSTTRSLAALGEVGYILLVDQQLLVDQHPSIGKVKIGMRGVRRLQFFPRGFRSWPRFEERQGWAQPRQATAFYETMEAATMPAGLFVWREFLYLLAREPTGGGQGETMWWLIKLDPNQGAEISRAPLPTQTAHLTVVPGDFWAFIEKGQVHGIGEIDAPYMDTSSVIFVPATWLENPDNSPLGGEPGRQQCTRLQ